MDLGNPIETVVHYLLIGGMVCLSCWDRFSMVNVLVNMVAHWTEPMVNHDIRLSIVMIHQDSILHGVSTLRGYCICVKLNKRLWPIVETLMWSYIFMD